MFSKTGKSHASWTWMRFKRLFTIRYWQRWEKYTWKHIHRMEKKTAEIKAGNCWGQWTRSDT